jgi:glutathione S-transferase
MACYDAGMPDLELIARQSSHFSRVARIFALELDVPHRYSPLFDLTSIDASKYSDNPVMKVPVLVTPEGPWFGSENIARELVRRARSPRKVAFREHASTRVAANAEELTLQAMATEVILILSKLAGDDPASPARVKVRTGLAASLDWLDRHLDEALAGLPVDRDLSFFEVALYCLVAHLPFRSVMEVTSYARLARYVDTFGERASARETPYRFDAPPA